MAEIFHLKQNDTSPAILFRLDPTANLTGATVRFNMRSQTTNALVVNRALGSVEGSPTDGVVRYDWDPQDTATEGTYNAEFEVTYSDGAVETFPNDSFIIIRIHADLG